MPTLSYCKSLNNCSPNLLHFKVARNEKLYFSHFFLALRFGPALHICLFILHNAHHALHFAHALLCFCSVRFWYVPLPCPVLPCLPLPCLLLPCPLLPCLQTLQFLAEATVRFCDWYIYITAIYLKTGVPENPLPDGPWSWIFFCCRFG